MVTPPDGSTWTDREMRHSPNITATALSKPKPTTAPTIISTTLRVPLDGPATAGSCPAGATPAGDAAAAGKPLGAPQPWQNLESGDSSAPHFEQKLAMGIPPVMGRYISHWEPKSPQFAQTFPAHGYRNSEAMNVADLDTLVLERIDKPFGPRFVTYVAGMFCHLLSSPNPFFNRGSPG